MKKIIIGSRGSLLATTQTGWVIERLKENNPGLDVELKIIKTTGDMDQKTKLDSFAGLGVFVKELRIALIEGEIDCAVHSLKDVPEETPEELTLASFPEREDSRDVFISSSTSFSDLPAGAKVGTGSPRRIMQLRQLRQDLEFLPLRGNLDTRIRKMQEGECDSLVVAAAGINRLGRSSEITGFFSFEEMIPAIGQGCLSLECRKDDKDSIEIARTINHVPSEKSVLLERIFMSAVGGGCKVPMACHARIMNKTFHIMSILGDSNSTKISRMEKSSPIDEAKQCVNALSDEILDYCRSNDIPVPKDLPDNSLLKYC